jgi:two-component system sensor histidine kinase UhpB
MSALGRINLLVTLFFVLVTLVSLAVLLRQAGADVRRELQAAQLLVEHLADGMQAGERPLPAALERQLRHVQLRWLEPGQAAPQPQGGWLTPDLPAPRLVQLADGRRLSLAVNPEDEIEEVWESLLQLLALSGLALLACLLAIRWGFRQALGVLEELLGGLRQISRGRLATRLAQRRLPEAQRLVGQFNEMADSLQRAEQDNEALTQALLTLQEQERNRLAQALHDDLGQYLAGLRAQVRLLELIAEQPLAVRRTAQTLEQHCEHLQHGFRDLLRDLYPVLLEHLDLRGVVQHLCEQWQASHGIACRIDLPERLPVLREEQRLQLYRLLQEALTNVARHAGASQVRLRLRAGRRRLRLLLRDDGHGYPAQRRGVGLRSMHERARCLGGQLQLLPRQGRGWTLLLDLPLTEEMP